MSFQIHALAPEPFAPLFEMDETELARNKARRVVVQEMPGAPCRVSLQDAPLGEEVILTQFQHHAEGSPFDASHAIYVRQGVQQARPHIGEIPHLLTLRELSLRAFDGDGIMINAALVSGKEVAPALAVLFETSAVCQVHIHYAAPGCFAARALRA